MLEASQHSSYSFSPTNGSLAAVKKAEQKEQQRLRG